MPYNLQIVRTADFVRFAGSQKKIDLGESRKTLSNIAKACIQGGVGCALLDVRDMTSELQLNDLYDLALAFREIGFKKSHRLAILHRARVGERVEFFTMGPGEQAEFFAKCASDNGWNVQAFDEYEKAIEWFGTALPA